MNPPQSRLEGTCRCGQVRFEVSAPPVITSACHCRGCQRMASSAYSLTAIFPDTAFSVTAGEPVKGGLQGPDLDHFFCPNCKTWMFTRVAALEGLVNVRPTLLEDPAWTRPFMETMTSAKLSWVETPARYSYKGFPSPEEFGPLLEEFARHLAEYR